MAGSGRECGRALHGDDVGAHAAAECERLAGGAHGPDIHANALGLSLRSNGGETLTRAGEQGGLGGTHHRPTGRNVLSRLDRLTDLPVLPAPPESPDAPHAEAAVAFAWSLGMLEAESVAAQDRLGDRDDQLILFSADHHTKDRAAVVGLRARDVVPARAPAIHPAGEAARKDLHERLDFGGCGRALVARFK